MKKSTLILTLALVIVISSCATIVSGSKQRVSITTTPANAKVLINGNNIGVTPLITHLKRSEKTHRITIELEGYKPYNTTLNRKLNGWFFGNIIFGGLIGIIVDASTGAMYRVSENELLIGLENNVSMTKTKDGIYVAVVMEADQNWEKIGNLEKN